MPVPDPIPFSQRFDCHIHIFRQRLRTFETRSFPVVIEAISLFLPAKCWLLPCGSLVRIRKLEVSQHLEHPIDSNVILVPVDIPG